MYALIYFLCIAAEIDNTLEFFSALQHKETARRDMHLFSILCRVLIPPE